MKIDRRNLSSIIFLSMLLLISGCSDESSKTENHQSELVEIDPHAGHDHGPGEHGGSVADVIELDWCSEHNVPESECTGCNPDLIAHYKETGDWCGGHNLPESHCRLCNPQIVFPQEEILRAKQLSQAENEIAVSLYFRENAEICATNDALIQFASATTAQRAGISVETVRKAAYELNITAPAETVFDEDQTSFITSTVKGTVTKWLKSPGELVEVGSALAIVVSPDITELKSRLMAKQAEYKVQRKEMDRHKKLYEQNLISQAEYDLVTAQTEQLEAELNSIEGLLAAAGVDRSDIEGVKKNLNFSNSFVLRSLSSGILVERFAQLGELIEAGKSYAMIADPQSMWVEAKLTEKQLRQISYNQKINFTTDGRELNAVPAEIIWISNLLDPHTRTGTVRAKILSKYHNLQANEFGLVHIPRQELSDVAVVPKDAVQWEGCCNVVFVQQAPDRYRPRKVELLDGEGDYYQVTSGLLPGENIVVEGAFLLKTELKKTSIGAGCCGIEPAS